MKRSVTVNVNEEKLSAIEMYLEQKSTTLAAELDKYIEQLYSKVVPQNVRNFIDMKSMKSLQERQETLCFLSRKRILSSNSPRFAPCAIVWRGKTVGGVSLP